MSKKIFFAGLFLFIGLLLISCKTTERKTGFAMQAEVWDGSDSSEKQVYITGTKPIDSVDVNKLIFDIFRIETDEYPNNLKIYARVYDSTGNFVTNLADPYKKDPEKKYFTSMTEWVGKVYNKRRVPIDSFVVREFGANDSIPYNIVLSVDYSGSITPVQRTIFEGTEIFISLKMAYDKIALTTFNKDLDIKVPFSSDKEKILDLYRKNRKRGIGLFSGVFNAVTNCIDLFENTEKDVPRVLVIFSDGDDNYSKQALGELVEKAKKEKVHIFSVAFGYSIDDNLRYLSKNTGGKFYKAYTKEELIAIFRDIYMSLRYHYYITYKPPKYWGHHQVFAGLNVPERTDTLFAEGEYDTSELWKDLEGEFQRPILFDFDSAVVKTESYYIIDELADAMMSQPRLKLEIQGHTDNVGTIEYNNDLSLRRAKAVYDLLVAKGIDYQRLRYRGFGMSKPVASNETEAGRSLNRRTVFVILAK